MSALGQLGKAAGEDGTSSYHYGLFSPGQQLRSALLCSAAAQVGQYRLVLELGDQEVSLLGAAALRAANKDTLRDFERDVVLATALAHCGLAREAFDAGEVGAG